MKKIILLILSSALIMSCSEEKRLLRRASNAVNSYDYNKAISYYDQILAKDSSSFYANAGKGIVLSEYMAKYDQAIPYLEKAVKKSPEKTSMKINNDLGKSYHFIGNYPRALYYYGQAAKENNDGNPDYDMFLFKRIEDCKYAMNHPEKGPAEMQWVKNAGNTINTGDPEYGPIYRNGKMYYTAKHQDDPKEKKNGLDGRYFESMYVAMESNNGNFTKSRRLTFPDLGANSKFKKGGESAVSVSKDGEALYVFRQGKIYEASLKDSAKEMKELPGEINFSYLQSYAFITSDGKTMFLTSESKKGIGGLDIYKSVKDSKGNWSKPEMLPLGVNTDYNEESPFMTEDGTLYFASEGLPGYGGYDIYKTKLVNGQWTTPQNLGQPINTPGDDMHFMLKSNSPYGYYASSQKGGYGDMDIYAVHYVADEVPECKSADTMFVINAVPDTTKEYAYALTLTIPEKYRNSVRSINWSINNQLLEQTSTKLDYTFDGSSTYTIQAKAIVYCDTCPVLMAMCTENMLNVGEADTIQQLILAGELNERTLRALGWNTTPDYFDFDRYTLRDEARAMLDQNVQVLKKYKDLTITIQAYADARGTNSYNMNLSEKRANAVKQYLLRKGVSKKRITDVIAYGESKIENGCTDTIQCTEEQHQQNRRAEIKVYGNSGNTNSKIIATAAIP